MNLQSLQQLLETEMDRKEFLLYISASLLAVVGISGLAKSLLPPTKQQKSDNQVGYGASTYGG